MPGLLRATFYIVGHRRESRHFRTPAAAKRHGTMNGLDAMKLELPDGGMAYYHRASDFSGKKFWSKLNSEEQFDRVYFGVRPPQRGA